MFPLPRLLRKSSQFIINRLFSERKYNIRRAVLYVPGNDERKIKKAVDLDVDCVILDCEDGVAINRKDEARNSIYKILSENQSFGRTERTIRVNSIETGLAEEDLRVILHSENLPSTIFFPKIDKLDDIDWIVDNVSKNLTSKKLLNRINIIIYIENAKGLLSASKICESAVEKLKKTPFVLDGIVFGSDDFCADIGATRTENAFELTYARQHLVVVAKAFGLQIIDMVHIDYKDLDGLKKNCQDGARMGFTGKQAIHPGQVKIIQQAFSPSEEKLEWASALTEAFRNHQQSGKGAFSFRGQMIDMPTVLQAKNILQRDILSKQ
uniref:Citramalyl-CoA lyase, mitochondrial n=1 Tax=Strigamia maritima TaxID=126957 RepID=T1IQC8_STRMM